MQALCQKRLTEVISRQKLEKLWTADHTMELLVISGLIGEASWFANCLGDWKIAFLLAVVHQYNTKNELTLEKIPYEYVLVPQAEDLMKERINAILKMSENTSVMQ